MTCPVKFFEKKKSGANTTGVSKIWREADLSANSYGGFNRGLPC
jgi:hypothetical protein